MQGDVFPGRAPEGNTNQEGPGNEGAGDVVQLQGQGRQKPACLKGAATAENGHHPPAHGRCGDLWGLQKSVRLHGTSSDGLAAVNDAVLDNLSRLR